MFSESTFQKTISESVFQQTISPNLFQKQEIWAKKIVCFWLQDSKTVTVAMGGKQIVNPITVLSVDGMLNITAILLAHISQSVLKNVLNLSVAINWTLKNIFSARWKYQLKVLLKSYCQLQILVMVSKQKHTVVCFIFA